jgi:beta-lactamase regulating signal transducer with metallopeptidase domain
MELRTVIDAYIDVNILMALSIGLWFLARRCLVSLGLSHSYKTQIRLLNGVFLATLISPFLAALIATALSSGYFGSLQFVNISDYITAQYLNGSFEMTPSTFEHVLGFRTRLLNGLEYMDTNLGLILIVFLSVGFGITILRLLLGTLRLRNIVTASTLWRRFEALDLRVSDTVSVPFSTRTLHRRVIIVPSSILDTPEDLKIALSHEFQHLRTYDLEWEIVLECLKPFFFWNPAFTLWKRNFEELRELSCDQSVLARPMVDAKAYCQSLLNICETSLKPRRLFAVEVPRVPLVETRNLFLGRNSAKLLRHRLESLAEGRDERHSAVLFTFIFVPLLFVTVVGSMAIKKSDDWSHDRLMLSTIVNLERLAAHNENAPIIGGSKP